MIRIGFGVVYHFCCQEYVRVCVCVECFYLVTKVMFVGSQCVKSGNLPLDFNFVENVAVAKRRSQCVNISHCLRLATTICYLLPHFFHILHPPSPPPSLPLLTLPPSIYTRNR